MAATSVTEAFALFTADGGADGYVTVTSNAAFFPGASAWIVSDLVAPLHVIITDLSGATKIGVRAVSGLSGGIGSGLTAGPQYGRTPISTYTLADHASIAQENSVVPMQSYGAVVKKDKI